MAQRGGEGSVLRLRPAGGATVHNCFLKRNPVFLLINRRSCSFHKVTVSTTCDFLKNFIRWGIIDRLITELSFLGRCYPDLHNFLTVSKPPRQ